ncbi:endonuclease/exonuclease/phosphatase family protein [Algibacter mikhailovii]|uniref:Endonuclease n=1 Tax=Algibacter mikhailovii TaxID=425498 RepID=A0A918RB42_9FLAO|nr:endonuclease/exonuclease/phosphatase family protein [Algibacter mikhailovii]GGZ90589.1 endonuclease [Algibacter mikhailovii]
MKRFRIQSFKIDVLLTVVTSALIVLGCLFIFLADNIISFGFSLIMPILLVLNLFFSVYWLVKKNKIFLLSFFCVVVYFLCFDFFIQFSSYNSSGLIRTTSKSDTLSVLSYNAQGFRHQNNEGRVETHQPIVSFLNDKSPNIFCIQEFSSTHYKYFTEYPYFFKTNIIAGKGKSVMAIFSKFPILDKGYISFPNTRNGAMFIDIILNKNKIRIYNVHLESYSARLVYRKNRHNNYFALAKRINKAEKTRKEQVHILKRHMDKFKGTVVLCGDFNSTQFSSAYNLLKGNLKDTYIEAGNGFGATYELFKYPFRLDYILVDDNIEVLSHKNFKLKFSDHEPILAKLVVKN